MSSFDLISSTNGEAIPTNGQTSFPCKVFYINKVHQMDITWGIPGEITLNDPQYDIFLHIGMCGNMNFRINDGGARKFMLKLVGFRDNFDAEEMISKFRGIIKQYVKSAISKISRSSSALSWAFFSSRQYPGSLRTAEGR